MAIALVQGLFSGTTKSSATTNSITGSTTVTLGNRIVFAAGARLTLTFTPSVTDNLGNTYTQIGSSGGSSGCWTVLFSAPVTNAGTLTTISLNTTNSVSAFAAIAGEFSGADLTSPNGTGLSSGTGTNLNAYPGGTTTATATQIPGNLWIGAFSWQGPVGTIIIPVSSTAGVAASQPLAAVGTTGNPTGTNMSCAFAYFICNANTANMVNAGISSSLLFGAAGADINPSVTATQLLWKPRLGPNYRR